MLNYKDYAAPVFKKLKIVRTTFQIWCLILYTLTWTVFNKLVSQDALHDVTVSKTIVGNFASHWVSNTSDLLLC